jgi:hypothetical protein
MEPLHFLWEDFATEPNPKHSEMPPLQQVMLFNMEEGIERPLLDSDFTPDETIAVEIVDAELRMPPDAPKNPETEEISIDL